MTTSVASRRPPPDFKFQEGQLFRRGMTVFRIVEDRGPILKLENTASLEVKVQELSALMLDYAKGLVEPATVGDAHQAMSGVLPLNDVEKSLEAIPFIMLSAAEKLHARTVLTLMFELRKLGHESLRSTPLLELEFSRIKKRLAGEAHLKDLALSTVYKWSLAYDEAGGDVRAVVPLFHERGGRGKTRTGPVAEKAFSDVFKELRKHTQEKIRPYDVEKRVENEIRQAVGESGLPLIMPARSTVARRIHSEFSPYEIAVRNKGKAFADREFRSWYPRDRAQWPLEVVEFDDKDARVFLIDEDTGMPYGRAFVTVGVDQYTRVPVGSSTSEMHRSTWSAICALTNVILPKDSAAPEFALVKSSIEFAGKPGIALFDNATYNHASEIDDAAREMNLSPAWARPYTPTEKSVVEDFNGRMDRDLFSTLPGYAGQKSDRAGLAEGTTTANLSRDEFQRLLNKWMYDVHCNTPGVDGLTPSQRWHEKMRLVKPRFPLDIYRLRIAPTLRHSVHFRPEGIRFTGLIYQSDHLKKLRKNLGAKALIEFRYDPRDMSQIYVFDPLAHVLFVVPSAQPEYTHGLTFYQHKLVRKMASQKRVKNPSTPQLIQFREELRMLVQQARHSTRKRERFFARRAGIAEGQSGTRKSTQKNPAKVVMTDLEGQISDIDDVEMEVGDEGWEVPELI